MAKKSTMCHIYNSQIRNPQDISVYLFSCWFSRGLRAATHHNFRFSDWCIPIGFEGMAPKSVVSLDSSFEGQKTTMLPFFDPSRKGSKHLQKQPFEGGMDMYGKNKLLITYKTVQFTGVSVYVAISPATTIPRGKRTTRPHQSAKANW